MTTLPTFLDAWCEDRLSLTNSDEPLVPSWSIILAVTSTLPSALDDLLNQIDSIAVTLGGASIDLSFLRGFLRDDWKGQRFVKNIWQKLRKIVWEMPSLFPNGKILAFTKENPRCVSSRRQTACLVIHQFLCTLNKPQWMQEDGSADFRIWYRSGQLHDQAVRTYLRALFTYFDRITADESTVLDLSSAEWPISITLHSNAAPPDVHSPLNFTPFTILHPPAGEDALLGLPNRAGVIFCNKRIGFGQSATQEEMYVGCTPEACPAVLLVQPLQYDEVIALTGAEAMVSVVGYGREARFGAVHVPGYDSTNSASSKWRGRTMLFMDALELDVPQCEEEEVPDLLLGHVERELWKAYVAFSSGAERPYSHVVTGFWGCGAFCGDPQVKTVIQWCAASMAGVPLEFVCEVERVEFLCRLRKFYWAAVGESWDVSAVLRALRALGPGDEGARMAFARVHELSDNGFAYSLFSS